MNLSVFTTGTGNKWGVSYPCKLGNSMGSCSSVQLLFSFGYQLEGQVNGGYGI